MYSGTPPPQFTKRRGTYIRHWPKSGFCKLEKRKLRRIDWEVYWVIAGNSMLLDS